MDNEPPELAIALVCLVAVLVIGLAWMVDSLNQLLR